jgi:signal recognition particle subunit SRP54
MFDSLTGALGKVVTLFRGSKTLTEANVEEGLRAVRQALLEADVHFKVAKDFIQRVKARALGEELIKAVEPGHQFIKIFHDELTALMGGESASLPMVGNGPTVIMMAGLQGSGKTTTCAKLALHLRKKKSRKPMLVAADLQRPAAVEQLVTLGKQLGIPVHAEPPGSRPPEVCKRGIDAAARLFCDVVILDTAGRLHIDDELMRELEDIVARCKPHGVVLVSDSMMGQDAVNSAKAFHDRLPLTGVILTKLDGDTRGGAAMSIKAITGRPILFVGTGEKPDDLEEFHPDRMAGRILGMGDVVSLVERAQEVVDQEDAEKQAARLMKGRFTFDDFLKSLQMVRKLGPMKKVLGMLPGVGQMMKDVDIDEAQFKRLEAMIHSMTAHERRNPDVIEIGRRRRIARGSGNELQAVHDLVKRFKEMQKMFGKMGKGGPIPGMPSRKGFRPGAGQPPGGPPFMTFAAAAAAAL